MQKNIDGKLVECSVLEYYNDTGLVCGIYTDMPTQKSDCGYAFALAEYYKPGDEQEKIIYVRQVDTNGFVEDGIAFYQIDLSKILLSENKVLRNIIQNQKNELTLTQKALDEVILGGGV